MTEAMPIEFNAFFENPKRHVKLTATSFEELAQLYLDMLAWNHDTFETGGEPCATCGHLAYLHDGGSCVAAPGGVLCGCGEYTAPSAPTRSQEARQPPQLVSVPFDPDKVSCGVCGGPTWNNNAGKGKSNPKGPDWTCKDKENCWARAWAKKDGTPGEWKPPRV